MFYALGHFAKFLPAGSKRIDVNSQAPPLNAPMEAGAFITPDGHTVVIVLNRDTAKHKFFIKVPERGYINVDNMPAHSMQTFVFAT